MTFAVYSPGGSLARLSGVTNRLPPIEMVAPAGAETMEKDTNSGGGGGAGSTTSTTGSGAGFFAGVERLGSEVRRTSGCAGSLTAGAAVLEGTGFLTTGSGTTGGGVAFTVSAGSGATSSGAAGVAAFVASGSATSGTTGFSAGTASGSSEAAISVKTLGVASSGLFLFMEFFRNTMPPTAVIMPRTARDIAQRPPPTAMSSELVEDRMIDEDEALGDLRLALD